MKYKLNGMEVPKDAVVDIPEGSTPLNVFYSPTSGKLLLALIEPVEEKAEEPSGEEKTGKSPGKED